MKKWITTEKGQRLNAAFIVRLFPMERNNGDRWEVWAQLSVGDSTGDDGSEHLIDVFPGYAESAEFLDDMVELLEGDLDD